MELEPVHKPRQPSWTCGCGWGLGVLWLAGLAAQVQGSKALCRLLPGVPWLQPPAPLGGLTLPCLSSVPLSTWPSARHLCSVCVTLSCDSAISLLDVHPTSCCRAGTGLHESWMLRVQSVSACVCGGGMK